MTRAERLEKLLTGEIDPRGAQAKRWFSEEPELEQEYFDCVRVEREVGRSLKQADARIAGLQPSAADAKNVREVLENVWSTDPVPVRRRRLVLVEAVLALAAVIVFAVWMRTPADPATTPRIPLGSKLAITVPSAGENTGLRAFEVIRWESRELPSGTIFELTVLDAQGMAIVEKVETVGHEFVLTPEQSAKAGKKITIRVRALRAGSSSALSIDEISAQLGG